MDSGRQPTADAGLKQLCLSLRGDLRRFLLARRVNDSDAEDLLQELFVQLENATTGPIRAPRAYLFRMLSNLAHVRRRTEMRGQSRDAAWIYHETEGKTVPDPETLLLARDHLARVKDQLDVLPERTLKIFCRYRIEKTSQKVIAHEFGISLSAVEKHLQRAYRAVIDIRRNLEEQTVEGGSDDHGR